MQPIDTSLIGDEIKAALEVVSTRMQDVSIPTTDGKHIRACKVKLVVCAPLANYNDRPMTILLITFSFLKTN